MIPVAVEATVTYYRGYEHTLFVQDGDAAIYVNAPDGLNIAPGDRVLVRGVTGGSFHPIVWKSSVTFLRHGALPPPVSATFRPLVEAKFDCRYVKVRGLVRWANPIQIGTSRPGTLALQMDGGEVWVNLDGADADRLRELLDAEVEIKAVAAGLFDGKMQLTGVVLHSSSPDEIKVIREARDDPWSIPATPMDRILDAYDVRDMSRRVRVEGVITYVYPASDAVLQDGSRSIHVQMRSADHLRVGDRAEAIGIPTLRNGFLTLRLGTVRSKGTSAPVTPTPANWDDLAHGRLAFNLISIEGEVVSQVREQAHDMYIISSGGHLFPADLHFPYVSDRWNSPESVPPSPAISPGSKVRITGVVTHENANAFSGPMAFTLQLRAPSDIVVLARPSWINVKNLLIAVLLLGLIVVLAAAWNYMLNRKVAKQAAELAAHLEAEAEAVLERQRSRVLEDINNGRPLEGILQAIVELISSRLGNASCWCELETVQTHSIGNRPAAVENCRVMRQEIRSRLGFSLGCVCVALDPRSKVDAGAADLMLSNSAPVIALAIDTQSTYSELRHRSEFDQLTETYNRFSFEKRLDTLIGDGATQGGMFGLVFIDLDEFKQVNDLYGHHVGDLYLQSASLRMKNQLRAGDLLARLGGDEFAALIPAAASRTEVEEIARRLKHCFDVPFSLDEHSLRGSASLGIAVFPDDGETSSKLLQAADAAMYAAKVSPREVRSDTPARYRCG